MELQIIDHVVEAHPQQQLSRSNLWRWGPTFDGGRWAVYYGRAAIRIAFNRRHELVDEYTFDKELAYWLNGQDRVDERLRTLDIRVSLPERVAIPAGTSVSWPVRESVEDALAELNEKARRELNSDKYAAPDDCPQAGAWVRAARLDDDMGLTPIGKWHLVTGWNGRFGGLGVECWTAGRNRTLNRALQPSHAKHGTLMRRDEQPPEDACQQCLALRQKRALNG